MAVRLGTLDLAGRLRIGAQAIARIYLGSVLVYAGAPRIVSAPYITGTPAVGQVLSSNRGTWDSDVPVTYSRQWLRNGVPISGATGTNYTLVAADAGKVISLRVTAASVEGVTVEVSAGTAPVAGGVPEVLAALLASDGNVFAYSGDMSAQDVGLHRSSNAVLADLALVPNPPPSAQTFIRTAEGSRRVTLGAIIDILET